MRIAFTGSSSTGKTTLANALTRSARFPAAIPHLIQVELQPSQFGFQTYDSMDAGARQAFRRSIFAEKRWLERGRESFLTDRSFVDIAAYWTVCDGSMAPTESSSLVDQCHELARGYDIHFYFPLGLVPQVAGARRSANADLHVAVDATIRWLLAKWELPFVALSEPDICHRVLSVCQWVASAQDADRP